MHLIFLTALFGISAAQFVPRPSNFNNMLSFSGCNGMFNSHSGYRQSPYPPGSRTRYVVTAPQGNQVQLSVDVTNPSIFKLRAYDYGVMFDGNSAIRILSACNVSSYTALGPSGVSYRSLVMADTSAVRTFLSSSNVLVVDFCPDDYNSGYDPDMFGFQAFWSCKPSGSVTFSPAPAPPGPPPPSGTPAPAPSAKTCGIPTTPPSTAIQRIVGGVTAPDRSWPWACALIHNGYQFCDCSILNSQWVITAAHCTASFSETTFKQTVTVFYGSQNLLTSQKASVSRMIQHPQYDTPKDSISHDVSLVKLSSSIPNFPNQNAAPICLPDMPIGSFRAQQSASNGRPLAFVAGWGTLYEGAPFTGTIGSGSDQLLQTTIEMYNQFDCNNKFGGSFPDTSICGGLDIGGRDSCQGDSGGPLVMPQADQTYALFGVVSFGSGCAEKNHPGAYSDVYKLSPWIKSTMQSN